MTQEPPALRRSLGIKEGVAIAASSTAATTSIAIGMGTLAVYAGRQIPVLLILAFLPILGIALAYARLNKSEPNCGNGYTWVGRSIGPWPGFLTGWVVIVGNVIFMAYTGAITGSVIIQFVDKLGLHLNANSTKLSTAIGLLSLLAVTILAITGVREAARLQLVLLVFEYAVLVLFCVWALIEGRQHFSLEWFDPTKIGSTQHLAQGLVLAVFIYWGWDAAFTVTEETGRPGDAARGGLIALVVMLGLFVFAAVAFERVMSQADMAKYGAQGLTYLGDRLADEPLASLPLMALMFSAFASLQAAVIPTARGALAMGRDRTLGGMWTRIHPKYGSPAAGTLVIMAVAAFVAVLAVGIPALNDMILTAVNSIGLLVALYYGLTAAACAVRFRHTRGREFVQAVVIPAASALALLALGGYLAYQYATMSDHFAAKPDNGWFLLLIPGLIIASGLVVAAWARWVRRSPYFHTGQGTDADAIALPMDATA